jgi:hypothetical protein
MQQSVLLTSLRGPDGIKKDHPVKVLCRWLRRCTLISAFDGRALTDPYELSGGSFTGPCRTPHVDGLDHALELYLRSIDELPHHFQLHFMHAAEILGYKHPDDTIRQWWNHVYIQLVMDAHLYPESQAQMDLRLGDNERGWQNRQTVVAE